MSLDVLAEYTDMKGTRWRLARVGRGPIELEHRKPLLKEWVWIADVCDDPDSLWDGPDQVLTRVVTNYNRGLRTR